MRILISVLMLLVLSLTIACSALPVDPVDSDPPAPVTLAMTELPDSFVDRLKAFLSQETGIPVNDISLQQAEAVDWSNSCLGAAEPDELCLMVITPGYRLVLSTPQGEQVVHSDRAGRSFRIASTPGAS